MCTVTRRSLLLSLWLCAAACASGGGAASGGTRARSDLITREEMQRGHWRNAFDLVETLRPRWLHVRGPDSILGETADVQVRLDDAKLGGVATLRGIPVTDVFSIQFVDPVSAAARWGADHANGAICVSTRPPK